MTDLHHMLRWHAKWHSHDSPCQPRNLRIVTTWGGPDNANLIAKHAARHVWSAVPATKHANTCKPSCENFAICACRTKWHVKCHYVPGLPRKTTLGSFLNFRKWEVLQLPRHGDAARKRENRDETCWGIKTNISREAFSHFAAAKSPFSCEFSSCHDTQKLLPQNPCILRGFRKIWSHVTKSPPLPRNLHVVTTWLKCCACHAKWRWAPPKYYRACHTERLLTLSEKFWDVMTCQDCHAKRGGATFEAFKCAWFCSAEAKP